MKTFTILANPPYLTRNILGFYHTNFHGVNHPDNPNFLYKLKNDFHHNWTDLQLQSACNQFESILLSELPQIKNSLQNVNLTICVVPRAKTDNSYNSNQLLFKKTIKAAVEKLGSDFFDGTDYIVRHINTKTTHLKNAIEGFVNDGKLPYPGITLDTCNISNKIVGRNILLIDDVYTKSINIDEDAIQALLMSGANFVVFYAIGKTVFYI
jgi:hypothetical protein